MTAKKSKEKPCLAEVMDELQSRFLVNLPESELCSSERLFFQIEQCYWFYEDFYADQYAHLQHVKLNDFARKLFVHCPLLRPLAHRCDELFQDFKTYQRQVPVVGCILLNLARTKVVLVRNWKGTSWTFPRGKVNEGETDIECARREVLEECGYDVEDSLMPQHYLELVANDQRMRMYMCTDVPEHYPFAPQTRKEISTIEWFSFDALPKKTWSVMPFMSRLKRWVKGHKSMKKKSSSVAFSSTTDRASSAPRNRPLTINTRVVTQLKAETSREKSRLDDRSISTPHNNRPASTGLKKANRGHFGTEFNAATSYDGLNCETFGTVQKGFSVEEMFSVNKRLTGQKFEYDGNPHDFGKPILPSVSTRVVSTLIHSKGPMPVQILIRPTSVPFQREDKKLGQIMSPPRQAPHSTPFGSFQFNAVDIMAVVN
ncbi:hypothetical protein CCR75_008057 [Bremia lactucae]|uniref:Nudix hydrolase domain-containing protein n=1 Tax=Bremia lactucae TaxID=4779 RepID=A0A976FDP2_BRELC|nr:hypothetical protein CCR75_008057 [Bremia lactucae]